MPPAEYQQRFVNALDGYFVACPGTVRCCFLAMTSGKLKAMVWSQISGPSQWMASIGLSIIRILFRAFCNQNYV